MANQESNHLADSMAKPLLNGQDGRVKSETVRPLASISYTTVFLLRATCALVGLGICVILTIVYHNRASNRHLCNYKFVNNGTRSPKNVLPNISTASGHFFPQVFISRVFFSILGTCSFLQAFTFYMYLKSFWQKDPVSGVTSNFKLRWGLILLYIISIVEHISFHGVIIISNKEYFKVHSKFCSGFMFSSEANAAWTACLYSAHRNVLFHQGQFTNTRHDTAKKWYQIGPWSVKYKLSTSILYITSVSSAILSYVLHEWYCFDHMYTLFGASEYVLLVLRIVFDYSTCFDLQGLRYQISSSNVFHK